MCKTKYILWILSVLLLISIGNRFSVLIVADQQDTKTIEKAWQSMVENQDDEAEDVLKEFLRQNKNNPDAHRALGLLHWQHGKYDEALQEWQEMYVNDQSSPWFHAFWPFFHEVVTIRGEYETLKKVSQKILETNINNQTIYTNAREGLASYFLAKGKVDKAREEYLELAPISEGWIIGPFDNTAGMGYDKIYPPEMSINLDSTYSGKYDRRITWHRHISNTVNGGIDLGTFLYGEPEAVVYFLTYISVPSSGDVFLKFGGSGSFKVWLNDQLAVEEDEYIQSKTDWFIRKVTLHEGWNQILVKGARLTDDLNFLIRFTSVNGKSIANFQVSSDDVSYIRLSDSAPLGDELPHWEIRTILLDYMEKDSLNVEAYLCLSKLYSSSGDSKKAVKILEQAVKQAPNYGFIYQELSEEYKNAERENDAMRANEKALKLNENLMQSQIIHINELKGKGQFDEAIDKLNLLIRKYPTNSFLHVLLAAFYFEKGLQTQFLEAAEEAASLSPRGPIEKMILMGCYARAGMTEDMWKLMEDELKRDKSSLLYRYLKASHLLGSGELEKAEKEYRGILKFAPNDPDVIFDLATLLAATGRLNMAVDEINTILSISPNNPSIYEKLGDLYAELLNHEKSKQAYQTSLAIDPTNYDVREKLRLLPPPKQPLVNLIPDVNVDSLKQNTPNPENYPESSSFTVLDEMKRVVYSDGGTVMHGHFIVKVLNKTGVDSWKEMYLDHLPFFEILTIEEASVLKEDGSKIEGDNFLGHISFSNLEPLDLIEVKWRTVELYRTGLGKYFSDEHFFQVEEPVGISRYCLLLPQGFRCYTKQHNVQLQPEILQASNNTIYIWETRNLTKFEHEDFMSPGRSVYPWIDISTLKYWDKIGTWFYDIGNSQQNLNEEAKETILQIVDEKEILEEKVRAIYKYVAHDITYSHVSFKQSKIIPQKVSEILEDMQGDCKDKSTLLLAMLKEIGVEGYYVLLNSRFDGSEPYLPSFRFDHCIVCLGDSLKYVWLDPTSRFHGFGELSVYYQGVPALVIKEDTTELLTIPVYVHQDSSITIVKGEIQEDGSLQLNVSRRRTGEHASDFRQFYLDMGPKERNEHLSKTFIDDFPGVVVDTFTFENLQDIGQPLNYTYSIRVPDYATKTGNLLFFQTPWTSKLRLGNLTDKIEREYALLLWPLNLYGYLLETIELRIPQGYRPMEVDLANSFHTSDLLYSSDYDYQNGILKCKRTLYFNTLEIPKDNYPEFKQVSDSISKEERSQLVFTEEE